MKSFNKVVIGIKLDEDEETLKNLQQMVFIQKSEIHLVHMSRMADSSLVPNLSLPFYPAPEVKLVIEQAVLNRLKEISKIITPSDFAGTLSSECLFSQNPKKGFCEHVNNLKADLVILMAEKSFLPFGSFVHYQLSHLLKPVFILKPST